MRSKKFVVLYAVAIFLIVFLITFNCVCSVSYIEVYFETDGTQVAAADAVRAELEDRYLRKNFLFFDEAGVKELVSEQSGGYFEVTSVEKSFPNTVTVRVREKYESYAFEKDGKYYVIGDDGTVLAIKDENVNNIVPGRQNIEIVGFDFTAPAVGDAFSVSEEDMAAYDALRIFVSELNGRGLAGNVLRVEYVTLGVSDPALDRSIFYVTCTEGVQIKLTNPAVNAQAKAAAALDIYEDLGDAQRTYGYITVEDRRDSVSGPVIGMDAAYSPEKPPEW